MASLQTHGMRPDARMAPLYPWTDADEVWDLLQLWFTWCGEEERENGGSTAASQPEQNQSAASGWTENHFCIIKGGGELHDCDPKRRDALKDWGWWVGGLDKSLGERQKLSLTQKKSP